VSDAETTKKKNRPDQFTQVCKTHNGRTQRHRRLWYTSEDRHLDSTPAKRLTADDGRKPRHEKLYQGAYIHRGNGETGKKGRTKGGGEQREEKEDENGKGDRRGERRIEGRRE